VTSHEELSPEADRAIDELLDAANEEVESEPVSPPPFAAVLDRARRLDRSLMPPSPELSREPGTAPDEATLVAALAPFVDAARAEAEHDIDGQERRGGPGLPGPSRGLTRWVIVGGALAAAAAVILLIGLLDVRNMLRAEAQRGDHQALGQVDVDRPLREAATGGDELPATDQAPRLGRTSRSRPAPMPSPIPEEPVPLEDIAPTEVIPEEAAPLDPPAPPPPPKRGTARSKTRRQTALSRLDEQASAHLAAGDMAAAEKTYRALVNKGGRSGLAELAYGDLFTLAHGRRDRGDQKSLWNEYLRKFPRGRFADDARAGLCRTTGSDARAECWERYLDEFPTGAYHRQAERALSRE